MSLASSVRLHDGYMHPVLGYGTYKVGFIPASASGTGGNASGDGSHAAAIVAQALQIGYRFLDCAQFYGNEFAVGTALAASGIDRSELFLASKVWSDTVWAGAEAVKAQVKRTLTELRTEYLDMYLVHWPVPGKHVAAYKALEEMQAAGVIKSIGVSNYTIEDYKELIQQGCSKPVVNQIEVNPFLYRKKTIDFFQGEQVLVQAYRALRQGKQMQHDTVQQIASKLQRTPAQVLGRWCIQIGCIYIPKSEKAERMRENAAVFDFQLGDDDMTSLNELTTADSLAQFEQLYRKCVVRDTPLQESGEGVKSEITVE